MSDTQLIVGLGSCGIAAGAQSVHEHLLESCSGTDIDVGLTSCMGACFAEPIVEVVRGKDVVTYGFVDVGFADRIIEGIGSGELPEENRMQQDTGVEAYQSRQVKIALKNCGHIDPENIEEFIEADGYKALRTCIEDRTPEDILEMIIESGLRGRGGSRFPHRTEVDLPGKGKGGR